MQSKKQMILNRRAKHESGGERGDTARIICGFQCEGLCLSPGAFSRAKGRPLNNKSPNQVQIRVTQPSGYSQLSHTHTHTDTQCTSDTDSHLHIVPRVETAQFLSSRCQLRFPVMSLIHFNSLLCASRFHAFPSDDCPDP